MHWAEALELPPTEQDAGCLHQAALAGLPLGKPEFIEDLEQTFARRLLTRTPGQKAQECGRGCLISGSDPD